MCIVAIKPAGVARPTDEMFKCMCQRNPDGFGMVTWDEKNGLVVKKTMDESQYMKWVSQVTEDMPAIFHMRIATHGSIGKKNCHPFIDEKKTWAFAHNGILSIQNEKDMTDTETFFKRIAMPIIRAGHTPGSMTFDAMVASVIGTSKFAFINNKGELFSYGNYITHNGILFSNSSYESYSYSSVYSMWPDCNPFSGDYGKKHGKKNSKKNRDENYELGFTEEEFNFLVDNLFNALYYDWSFYDGMSDQEMYEEFKQNYIGLDFETFKRALNEANGCLAMDDTFDGEGFISTDQAYVG